ncbi:NDP-hexose 2,3-dehydratase family protein [Geotalea toluenoxydans]|uniref:NDP-hexose 2,3-dehydratase family protein n=1 Tax=Geotalea toluenoxydans TaxID=421624 RepID=UPI0006D12CB8|nr:NDP-hexose 2,3-dehydratase family protein [Geotalea toluenoxydans]
MATIRKQASRFDPDSEIAAVRSDVLGFGGDVAAEIHYSRTTSKAIHSDDYIEDWIARRLASPRLQVKPIPLAAMAHWLIESGTGNIIHDSGMFFTITGVKARHRSLGGDMEWDQPIIDQPEIGILGILVKSINGVLHFCLQAKEEPGNINSVQLSPTVQATYSNYTKAHGGAVPPLVGYFLNPQRQRVLFAKLQTEDGGRFLFKSNRNMIVRVGEGELEELPDHFIWLTLRQIALLLRRDNLVHACTRSIISSLVLSRASQTSCAEGVMSLAEAIQWLDDEKAANHITVKRQGLKTLKEWLLDEDCCFSHREKRFFRVIGIDVKSVGREVSAWSQPILDNPEMGIIGLLTQVRRGERHFLMQAKAEVGNRSMVQLGPTVQFTPSNYAGNEKLPKPFLFDDFSAGSRFPFSWQNYQAEEGARFYREAHLHRIAELPEGDELPLPQGFCWMSETQLRFFLHLGETVNSCARSIISCLL